MFEISISACNMHRHTGIKLFGCKNFEFSVAEGPVIKRCFSFLCRRSLGLSQERNA